MWSLYIAYRQPLNKVNFPVLSSLPYPQYWMDCCAQGESRTRTSLQTADFESAGSTIPPLGQVIENKRISVVTFLKSHCDDIPHHQDVQRRNFTYITLLSSPSILGEYAIEAPTLDSQYNKRTQQISVVTVIGELDGPFYSSHYRCG